MSAVVHERTIDPDLAPSCDDIYTNNSLFDQQLHLVHWNTTDFDSFSDAVKAKGGLAVLGVLLAVSTQPVKTIQMMFTLLSRTYFYTM